MGHTPISYPEAYDYDWFAVDSNGYVLHFASAGGMLPASVAASEEVLFQLKDFFQKLPPLVDSAAITIAPTAHKGWLDSYLHYVSRGLFSFDRNEAALRNGHLHLLIAAPTQPIVVQNLPPEIAHLVSQTRWPYSVVGVKEIDTLTIE